jgi:hypothetical protein
MANAYRLEAGDWLPDGGQVFHVGHAISVRYTDVYGFYYHQILPFEEVDRRIQNPRNLQTQWEKDSANARLRDVFG